MADNDDEQLETTLSDAVTDAFANFHLPERVERLNNVLDERTSSLTVVLDHVQNYHNISAVIRSADAFGVSSIHLIGNSFQFSSGITRGTERWLELKEHNSCEAAYQALRESGFEIVVLQPEQITSSTSGTKRVLPVSAIPFERKLALVFGNEHSGVNPLFSTNADFYAYIPMKGFVESLNISVACAITLYCSTIAPTVPQRRTKELQDGEKSALRSDWLKNGRKRAESILKEVTRRALARV